MLSLARLRIAALASLIAGPLCLLGSADAADLSGLAAWVGKYPFDRVGGRQFYDYPGLRAELRRTLGAEAYRAVERIKGPEVPVVRVEGYIAAYRCMAHDCGDRNTTTIVRLARGDVVVCWHGGPGAATRWFIPGRSPVAQADARGGGCPSDEAELRGAVRRFGL